VRERDSNNGAATGAAVLSPCSTSLVAGHFQTHLADHPKVLPIFETSAKPFPMAVPAIKASKVRRP